MCGFTFAAHQRSKEMRAMRAVVCLAIFAMFSGAIASRTHRGSRFVPSQRSFDAKGTESLGAAAKRRLSTGPFFNVEDYGAKGDNATDNTAAFASAIAAASGSGGGTVLIPAGLYQFQGEISIPSGVNLKGSYETVPSHQMVGGGAPPNDGTVLLPFASRGNVNGPPFITVNSDATFAGCVILYPQQESVAFPVPYPYTISMTGNNAAVTDVELLNSFNGIYAVQAHRHYIARVQGQARVCLEFFGLVLHREIGLVANTADEHRSVRG
jgi:hypothetical protein